MNVPESSPLHEACQRGDLEIVRTLLLGATADIVGAKDRSGRTPLHLACKSGHVGIVEVLLEADVEINAKDKGNSFTPLHLACYHGHVNVVEVLLEQNADIEAQDRCYEWTPLHFACNEGHINVVKKFLERNVDINAKSEDNLCTPLHVACEQGHIKVVEVLLEAGVDIEAKDEALRTPLLIALSKDHIDIVELLLERNADIEVKDRFLQTPLYLACWHGCINVVEVLLERNVDIRAKDRELRTPLHIACAEGHVNVVGVLLERNADIEAQDRFDSWTPLHYACVDGHVNVVEVLLEQKVDFEAKDWELCTPLHLACKYGHIKVVEVLLEAGVDIKAKTDDLCTPLHLACQEGHLKVVEVLLERNADIEAKTKDLWTPLHHACSRGYIDVVEVLSKANAEIEAQNKDSWTPLHAACRNGRLKVVEVLLELKANIEAKTKEASTPFHLACRNGHIDVVEVLLEAKVDIEAQDKNSWTPLHVACRNGHLKVVEVLLELKADIEAKTKDLWTPLYAACWSGLIKIVKLLLKRNADIGAKTEDLWTPLHAACRNGHIDVVEVLLEQKAALEAKDEDSWTPLHYACYHGHIKVVEVLLKANVDIIEAKTKRSQRPGDEFSDSVDASTKQKIRQLLDEAKCLKLKFDACRQGRIEEVKEIIKSDPAFVNEKRGGLTPLHIACYYGQIEVIKILLEANSTLGVRDDEGKKPGETFDESFDESTWFIRKKNVSSSTRREVQRLLREEERASFVKCQFDQDIIKFPCHRKTTFEEFLGIVESKWKGEKRILYKDEDKHLVVMQRTEELMWVRERNKTHAVVLTVQEIPPPPPPKPEFYDPPLPIPPRTFATSNYLLIYNAQKSENIHVTLFLTAIHEIIEFQKQGDDDELPERFFRELYEEMHHNSSQVQEMTSEIQFASQRLWTSTKELRGREFCSILNGIIREDHHLILEKAMKVIHGINKSLISRTEILLNPPDNTTYRGAVLPLPHLQFYQENQGRKVRAPMYLATSLLRIFAEDFMERSWAFNQRAPTHPPALWIFRWPESGYCRNARKVTKRAVGVSEELEYLFVPYSVFLIREVSGGGASLGNPIIIHMDVMEDNKREAEDMPLLGWC